MKQQLTAGIVDAVRSCGVVGAGGGGFPTHKKLSSAVDVVVVNGAECEPLLASDKYLLETQSDGILRGLILIMQSCGAVSGYIALKAKHSRLLQVLSEAIDESGRKDLSLFPLGDFYPAGDEFLLVEELTKKVVPERGIPPQVGCLVENVETTLNIQRAVELGEPVIRRYLTCSGEVRWPSVIKAHIGTSFREIIDLCGGATVDDPAVVVGGPLMGKVETDLETPATKLTSGIIVLSRDHEVVRRKTLPIEHMIRQMKAACCQCTYCTELCPRYLIGHDLEPHLIMRQIAYGVELPSKTIVNALLCSGCGLCEIYACVMGLSPQRINAMIKEGLAAQGYSPDFPVREIRVHEMMEYRKIPTDRIVTRLKLTRYAQKPLRRHVETNPVRVEIPLTQHAGAPSVPVVKQRERVVEGALIAEIPKDSLGAAVHSSIDGEVIFLDEERIIIQR
jgi:Na+-translocating ferredoxin:NAD+ oxidoreductase RnfC subunit